jgi:hypothetical protein
MIAVRTDRSPALARSRIPSMAEQTTSDEEDRSDALLVKLQRPVTEGLKPVTDADLCFGCVDWYMYPRQRTGKTSSEENG